MTYFSPFKVLREHKQVFVILSLIEDSSPNGNFFAGLAAQVGLVYFSLTIGLNVITTCLICGRIIFYARHMGDCLGGDISKTYFTAVSIVIESALPYSLFGIAFLVSYGLGSDISILFLSFYTMFTVSVVDYDLSVVLMHYSVFPHKC